MKQSKRMLSVLLAMIMLITGMTVGVSAYETDYSESQYDSVYEPVFTTEQAASAILDMLDDILGKVNVNTDIEVLSIHIHIYSLDTLYDTIKNIFECAAYKAGSLFFSLGDLEKLDVSIPRNGGIRRRSTSMSDLEVLNQTFAFLANNADRLYKWADNTFNLGIIDNAWDPRSELPMLNDLHGYVNEMVYKLLIKPDATDFKTDSPYNNLDYIIQDFLNNHVIKFVFDMLKKSDGSNPAADFLGIPTNKDGTLKNDMGLLGLLPSLKAADISINNISTYDLIENLFGAIIDDIVLPYTGKLILDLLKISPEDTEADTSYINIAITLFATKEEYGLSEEATDEELVEAFLTAKGVENPSKPKPIDKVNTALEFILKEGITKYIFFVDDGHGGKYLHLQDDLIDNLSTYVKTFLPIIGTVWADAPTLTDEESAALEKMNSEQTFAFLVKFLLEALVDNVTFSDNCDSIRELATYTLIDVCKDLIPGVDFEQMMVDDPSNHNPNSNWCLDIAAAVGRYYLCGETSMEIDTLTPTIEELMDSSFEYFLGKYSKLFNIGAIPGNVAPEDKIWYKVYMTVNQWIPFTNLIYGIEDSYMGVKELVMDKLIGNILDFDIQQLVSIIGKRTDSDFMKPLTQVLVNLVARIMNGVFQLPNEKAAGKTDNATQLSLIFPYGYTKLDQMITNVIESPANIANCGLKNTVHMLLRNIVNITGENSLCGSSLDLVATLISAIDVKQYDYMTVQYNKNATAGLSYSINDLKALYSELSLAGNEGKEYDSESYEYFHMVDFAAWTYLDFKKALRSAEKIISQYDAAKNGETGITFPTRSDITFSYYILNRYKEFLLEHQTITIDYQLVKVYNAINSQNVNNDDGNGGKKYTDRTWSAFTRAKAFAEKVIREYNYAESMGQLGDYRQSKVNEARQQLSKAFKNLKKYVPLADYKDLDDQIVRVSKLNSPSRFTQESVNAVIEAYKYAKSLARDFDQDEQPVVTRAYERLYKAIAALESVASIEFNTTDQHIDDEFNYLFGFKEGFWNDIDRADYGDDFPIYFSCEYGYSPDGDIYIDETPLGSGTGSKIYINSGTPDEPVVANSYTLIHFGDINGDGYSDAQDAVLMRAYASFMLDEELSPKYISYAGDINFDGVIGTSDATSTLRSGLFKEEINQQPSQYTEKTMTFLDLL